MTRRGGKTRSHSKRLAETGSSLAMLWGNFRRTVAIVFVVGTIVGAAIGTAVCGCLWTFPDRFFERSPAAPSAPADSSGKDVR